MFSWADFWAGVTLPAVVAGGVLVAGWWFARRRHWPGRQSRSWLGPLALAGGFVAGYLALLGWPGFPPRDVINWLLFFAPALAALGLLDANRRLPLQGRLLLLVAVAPAMLLLAWPLVNVAGPAGDRLAARIGVAVAVVLFSAASLDVLSAYLSGARFSACLSAAAAPAAVVLLLSGSQRLGQIGGLLAAAVGGMGVAYYLLGRAATARGVALGFATLYVGLLWCGTLYAELSAVDAVLLAAAPNLAWLAMRVPPGFGERAHAVVQVVVVLAAAGLAVAHAWVVFARDAM